MSDENNQALDQDLQKIGRALDGARVDKSFIEAEASAERGIAYTFKDDYAGEIEIKRSANAWWMDDGHKIEILIGALKDGHTIKAACWHANISRAQWQYFNKIHPEFELIVQMCEEWLEVRALDTVSRNLHDPKMARWFLERRNPKFKTKFTLSDVQGEQFPSVLSNIFEEGDPEKVGLKLMHIGQTMLTEHRAQKQREALGTKSDQ